MTVEGGVGAGILLLARLLFGGPILFKGLKNFRNYETHVSKVDEMGIPVARISVGVANLLLILGGFGLLVGIYPTIASGMIILFLLLVTPLWHDFWSYEGENREHELNAFLDNVILIGGAMVFLLVSGEPWGYALNIGF